MIDIEKQIELFKLIGIELKKKVECYVIGGSAMLFYGLKSATKGVDIVFTKEEDRNHVIKVLKKIGFSTKSYSIFKYEEVAKTKPILMEKTGTRFDLFLNEIITTNLSSGIIDRVQEKHEFSNLVANIVSPEDIILLKCATEREGDKKDAISIINSKEIKWETIINEAEKQTQYGKKIFPIFLFDFVMSLKEDHKINIPLEVIKKITQKYEEEMIKLAKEKNIDV